MEKGLQPSPITGVRGNQEQLGLRMSVLQVVASVWQATPTPHPCDSHICSLFCCLLTWLQLRLKECQF